jgi:curved DNA-binding protein CbpA
MEDMNHYEILGVRPSASQQEIEKAYRAARHAYGKDSLAHYGLLGEEEREEALNRVDQAYKVLSSPRRRKSYDVRKLRLKSQGYPESYFRNTTSPMRFEEEVTKPSLLEKIKRKLFKS